MITCRVCPQKCKYSREAFPDFRQGTYKNSKWTGYAPYSVIEHIREFKRFRAECELRSRGVYDPGPWELEEEAPKADYIEVSGSSRTTLNNALGF